jgi:hypothetical protein
MAVAADQAGQRQATRAHSAHEGSQKHAQRDGGRADDELEQLEPDDFVDQSRASAADEEQDRQRQIAVAR